MRTTAIAGAVLSILLGACASTSRSTDSRAPGAGVPLDSDRPIESSGATLVVHGLGCPLCANNVEKELNDVPGVVVTGINLETGRIGLAFSRIPPSPEKLNRIVTDSGFELVSIEPR